MKNLIMALALLSLALIPEAKAQNVFVAFGDNLDLTYSGSSGSKSQLIWAQHTNELALTGGCTPANDTAKDFYYHSVARFTRVTFLGGSSGSNGSVEQMVVSGPSLVNANGSKIGKAAANDVACGSPTGDLEYANWRSVEIAGGAALQNINDNN